MTELLLIGDSPVLLLPDMGEPLGDPGDATALIGEAFGCGATWVALPSVRLREDFLELRTRTAGEFLQKFVTYGVNIAVIGDIADRVTASASLRAFVDESNRGGSVWFLPDLAALRSRLT